MSFSLWATPFTDFVTKVPASWFNKVRVDTSQAVDGAGGGVYTPAAEIEIGGSGLKVSGPFTLSGATNWPIISSRTVTMRCPLVIVGTSQEAVPSAGTDPDQTLKISDVANVHAVLTKSAGATGKYTWLSLGHPPDGNAMASVVVTTKGTGAATTPATQLATYQIIRWAAGTAYQTMSTATADAHTYGAGNWLTTAVATTVTVNANATIDNSLYEYALIINHPADAGVGSAMYVYSVAANYTCTKMQL